MMAAMECMSQRLDDLAVKVEKPSGASTSHSTSTPRSAALSADSFRPTASRDWVDISVTERLTDYNTPLSWEDDQEEATPLRRVSEDTGKILRSSFGRPLTNQARLTARKAYPFPDVETTRCPKLDPVAKQLLQREQKAADGAMAKLQTLLLDAVAPLVHIVEEAGKGSLSVQQAAEAAKSALSLLGNASAHMSRECRKRVITHLNKKVHPLADEEEIFVDAAPLLLGKVFELKMKSHLESLKCLSASARPEREGQQYFQRSHSSYPPRGSGGNSRRGGRGNFQGGSSQRRFQPYPPRGKRTLSRDKVTLL